MLNDDSGLPKEEIAFKEAVRKWQTQGKTESDFQDIFHAVGNLKDLQKQKVDTKASNMRKKFA